MKVIAAYHHIGDKSQFVDEDESNLIAVEHFEVDGRWISSDVAELRTNGPFLTLVLRHSHEDDYPYIERSLEQIRELRASLTPDDWLEETDDDKLVLPVSVLHWAELARV